MIAEFEYLKDTDHYFDTACQTLRPSSVIRAEQEYYFGHNACGGRSSYTWAKEVDYRVSEVRKQMIRFLKLSSREYRVFFSLNTTSGINQILWGIDWTQYDRVVTSEIEHNSVFLPTLKISKFFGKSRVVLPRDEEGNLVYTVRDLEKSVVVVNTTSNINGLRLNNVADLIQDTHKAGGIVILDACQTLGHDSRWICGMKADAILMSGHKMYGPSLGIGVIRSTLLDSLDPIYVGGGTVSGVEEDGYHLLAGEARLEAGLQNWAAIWAMKSVLDWYSQIDWAVEHQYSTEISSLIRSMPGVVCLSPDSSPVQAFHIPGFDSHLIGKILSKKNIMVRTGHFCCHYYLTKVKPLPPLVRISVGLHTRPHDIEMLKKALESVKKLN